MNVHKPNVVLHYRERAESFYKTCELVGDDPAEYGPAMGLLSVHACIALADAVLVSVGEKANKRQNESAKKPQSHLEAAQRLEKWCLAPQIDISGIKHFEWLLTRKNKFSYDDIRIDESEFKQAMLKMMQFFVWVTRSFKEINELGRPEPGDKNGDA